MQQDDDAKARQERARELRKEIDELLSGGRPHRPAANPREFIAEKMKEMAEERRDADPDDPDPDSIGTPDDD